jgi:hypothetical protein
MSRRSFAWLLGFSCLIPVVLLAIASLHPDQVSWFARPRDLVVASLYLVVPHLIFGILALTVARSLLRVAVLALIALNLALVSFLIWIWSLAPQGEDGIATVLYIPVWMIILTTAFIFARMRARRSSRP